MKKEYIVTYLPHGEEDKRWTRITASDSHTIMKEFKAGVIIDIREEGDYE